MVNTIRVSVLLYEKDFDCLARCLEHDLLVQGRTWMEVRARIMHLLTISITQNKFGLEELSVADQRYFKAIAEHAPRPVEIPVYIPTGVMKHQTYATAMIYDLSGMELDVP